ncbi:hypothetical protein LINPERPRIM_LOCUS38160 [Linum perenne]
MLENPHGSQMLRRAPQDKTLILKGRHPSEGLPKPEGNGDQRRRGDHR